MRRMRQISPVKLFFIFSVLMMLPLSAAEANSSQPGGKISYRLEALSRPAVASMSGKDQAALLSLPPKGPGSLMRNRQGQVLVYIRMSDVAEEALGALRSVGVQIVHVAKSDNIVTGYVAPSVLSSLENIPAVLGVTEALAPETRACSNRYGSVLSEGYTQLNVSLAWSTYGLDGSGVKVGILSDSYNQYNSYNGYYYGYPYVSAANDVLSGDLPGTANTCGDTTDVDVFNEGPTSGGDEGRGMLQIVHDLAPGAQLSFASAFNGLYSFADNIRSLRNTVGADIIADDVFYYVEPFFQDGPVNVAISDVVGAGALYFTAAGNENLIDLSGNNISSYEAPAYRPTTCPSGLPGYAGPTCHNFEPVSGSNAGSGVWLADNCTVRVDLQWNEPWYGVATDLDVFLLDDSNNVVASSGYRNVSSTQWPFEYFSYQNTTGSTQHYRIVINRYSGTANPRLKYVYMQNGNNCLTSVQYNTSNGGDIIGPSITGHSATNDGFSTAAVPYDDSTTPEFYTSRGPASHYYGPVVGSSPAAPISPEVFSGPAFAATDGGCTTFFADFSSGCWRFYGTSAAAPHAAGVATLLRQEAIALGAPTLTVGDAANLLKRTAQPVSYGDTSSVGAGFLNAFSAVDFLHGLTYYLNPVLKIPSGSGPAPCATIGDAYLAFSVSSTGNVIEAVANTFTGDLTFGSNIGFALMGGYDSQFFLARTGWTTVSGKVTIAQGTVTVDGITITN